MKLGWQVAIVVAAVGTGLYLSRKPWIVYGEQMRSLEETRQEMREAESEHERLLKQEMELSSPLGKEKLWRNKGRLKKGETPANE
jgi:hypothetical protein